MFIVRCKSLSPGLRNKVISRLYYTTRFRFRRLSFFYKRKKGRSVEGWLTNFYRGGGVKCIYRRVDFYRRDICLRGRILSIEYDPFRSSYIALIRYRNGCIGYILAANKMRLGGLVYNFRCPTYRYPPSGSALLLQYIDPGSLVHNIELQPGKGGQIVRAAGTAAKVLKSIEVGFTRVRLPSGIILQLSDKCTATIGRVSNIYRKST
jgi:large subunit ribosomal protein L2